MSLDLKNFGLMLEYDRRISCTTEFIGFKTSRRGSKNMQNRIKIL